MEEEYNVYTIVKAAVSHLVNTFAHSANLEALSLGQIDSRVSQTITRAARLAASDEGGTTMAPLVPVLGQVELVQPKAQGGWGYTPGALSLAAMMPRENLTQVTFDVAWWTSFIEEITRFDSYVSQPTFPDCVTLLALVQKYLSLVPSPAASDVSLYAHIHVTAAVALCLLKGLSKAQLRTWLVDEANAAKETVAVMVRGDFSGIQNFIYHITRPTTDASYRGVAKRLRGRSFYLMLLGDVITDWIVRRLGLTPANILFCGGGRFDLLIPQDSETLHILRECLKTVEAWLLQNFYGELGIQFVTCMVSAGDFMDISQVYETLEYDLGQQKTQKWRDHVLDGDFHTPKSNDYHACAVCNLSVVNDSGDNCPICDLHAAIGGKLPDAQWLAWIYGTPPPSPASVRVGFEAFETTITLLNDKELPGLLPQSAPAVVYRLNDANFMPPRYLPTVGWGFRFLPKTAPVALTPIPSSRNEEPTKPGDVLDFDQIAALSTGAQRLGVLKADVDHLGLVFSEGLRPLTLARQATLSHSVDRYFAGRLNRLCDEVFADWKAGAGAEHPLRGKVSHLFYILYAGGDDLFVVGPWDQIMELAQHLRGDFETYACRNPNVTLSAGVVQIKPHYPVQRFATLVSERLERAKQAGRRRINVFGHTSVWAPEGAEPGFAALFTYAKLLTEWVGEDRMPRTLVHYLGRLYAEHFKSDDANRSMYLPKLYYAIRRRMSSAAIQALDPAHHLWTQKMMDYAPILVSYVSLITRKE